MAEQAMQLQESAELGSGPFYIKLMHAVLQCILAQTALTKKPFQILNIDLKGLFLRGMRIKFLIYIYNCNEL